MKKTTKSGLRDAYVAIAFVAATIGAFVHDGNARRNMLLLMVVIAFPLLLGWWGRYRRGSGDADSSGPSTPAGSRRGRRRY
jgi:hypothetical protein